MAALPELDISPGCSGWRGAPRPSGGALVALGPYLIVDPASSKPFSVQSTVFPTSSRRSNLRLFSFKVAIGSGLADLRYAFCLDNLNHTEAGHVLTFGLKLLCCQAAQELVRYRLFLLHINMTWLPIS